MLQSLIPLLVTVSMAGIVLAIGLDADLDDLLCVFRRPLQLAKAVFAVNIVVPAAAVLLVFLFPLTPIARAGVLLMAVSPVPPLVPGKAVKTGADRSYAYGLYTALILLAVIVAPAAVEIVGGIFGAELDLPIPLIARNVALSVLLPLASGLAIRRFAPTLAQRAKTIIGRVGAVLLLVALIPLLFAAWPAIVRLVGNGTILAMALTSTIGLAAGHLLGGPDPQERSALAVASAMRHPGIALMIATANAADRQVTGAILMMLLVGMAVTGLHQAWLKRRPAAPSLAPHS